MDITNEMLTYVRTMNWDDDITQDVWVKVLEYTGRPPESVGAWLGTIYTNARNATFTKDHRRRELERENVQAMENVHGMDDVHDPFDYLVAEGLIDGLEALSPLLQETLAQYVEGTPVSVIASVQQVEENVIYQRIHQAKKELQDGR